MGCAISWCAVREDQGEAFLVDLGLARTGKQSAEPDFEVAMRALPSGWRLFVFDRSEAKQVEDHRLPRLSAKRELLVCHIEEHVMASSSEIWSGGVRQWQLYHQGEDGPQGLDVIGTPPAGFAAIRAAMEQLQREEGGLDAEVDHLFDIPLLVARRVTGFKHDDESEFAGGTWQEVDFPKGGGFFSRLFGK